jgi:phosphate transport system substrate-binding protein
MNVRTNDAPGSAVRMLGARRMAYVAAALFACATLSASAAENSETDAPPAFEAQIIRSLPRYRPQGEVSGVISIWGHGRNDLPWMRPLVEMWIDGLRKFHPGISLDYRMHGTSSGVPSLFTGIGDIAILGEEILPEAVTAFEHAKHYAPLGIELLTGSVDVRNFDYAQQFFVHRDNPLERATLAELDAIFGAEHRRGAANIRTWGQLGLKGEWAAAPITPYGWKLDDSFAFYIQEAVLAGSHRWNCDLHEYAHMQRADGTIYDHGQQILDALTRDRHGIAVSNIRYSNPALKPLALAAKAGGPYYQATKQSLIERKYPLTRTIPAIIDRAPGTPVDPKVREFLRYVLSRDGQEAVNRDGRYLPLAPDFIAEQLKKLE